MIDKNQGPNQTGGTIKNTHNPSSLTTILMHAQAMVDIYASTREKGMANSLSSYLLLTLYSAYD